MFIALSPPSIILVVVWAVLLVATAIGWGIARMPTSIRDRIKTWWVLIGFFSAAYLVGAPGLVAFAAGMSLLALRELLSLMPWRQADRRAHVIAFVGLGLQYVWVLLGWYGMFTIFLPLYTVFGLTAALALGGETRGFLRASSQVTWALMLTVYGLSHAPFLLSLGIDQGADVGWGLAVILVVLTQLNDVVQFLSGKMFGRRPLAPKVSPNKTFEGALGGVLFTTAAATVLVPWLAPLAAWQGAICGVVIALGGIVGDLVMSATKRDLDVKDASQLLPGHGGALDRIDSLTVAGPLFFHLIRFWLVP